MATLAAVLGNPPNHVQGNILHKRKINKNILDDEVQALDGLLILYVSLKLVTTFRASNLWYA